MNAAPPHQAVPEMTQDTNANSIAIGSEALK